MYYEKILATDTNAIKELSHLAIEIVKEHFDPIIGTEQNDYMIRKFQSVSAIKMQLEHGSHYYFVIDNAGNKVGFLAYYPTRNELYLSKFYLQKEQRGKGIAREILQFVIQRAIEEGFTSIVLNVNKNNSAVLSYERLGFKKIGEERKAIGNGFFMDDFIYEYRIR